MQRAATSVPLNIAEGAGEHSPNEKARFYRIAKRSATECSSILDVCRQLHILDDRRHMSMRELLLRIVAMLTKMSRMSNVPSSVYVKEFEGVDTDTGSPS